MEVRIPVVIALVLFLSGCAAVPLDVPKEPSYAMTDTAGGLQAREVTSWTGGNPDLDGFYPLMQGFDAFGARLALIAGAEYSIDAQYFLMKPDYAGLVFAGKLLQAADRGVRVRLLLDDVFTTVEDIDLAMLDDHPNIQIRIFNPTSRKGVDFLNYVGNFKLSNRRMHNKSFTVDNQVAIVGGRNIADEYYQLESNGEFIDFDMLSVGPIVNQVSDQFDLYWNHQLAVPMAVIFQLKDSNKIAQARASLDAEMAEAGETIYAEAISTPVIKQLESQELAPYIANAQLLTDSPEKLLTNISPEQQVVVNDLRSVLAAAEQEIIVFTPYFIPRKEGIAFLRELNEKGISVTVVTNSLATNNHTAVHSAYMSYRKDLLNAGVELWEARKDAAMVVNEAGDTEMEQLTLHTKGILIDRKRIFVGSLNLDPRSIDINTEMGLLIDSSELGAELSDSSRERIPRIAYRVQLNENGNLSWHATVDGETVVETKEPQTSAWRRFSAWIQKIAPEDQL